MARRERTGRKRDRDPDDGERYRRLVELSPDAIAVHQDGVFLYANPATAALFGLRDVEELLGRSVAELVAPESLDRVRSLLREVEGVRPGRRFLFDDLCLAHGARVDLEVSAAPVVWEGKQARQVVARDVTEQRRAEARLLETQQELRRLAFRDALTDLPNRALFEDRLAQALKRTSAGDDELAVLFLDLDRFKVVNDTLGHTAGDALLADVGRRLRRALPEEHTLTRFGGDEFAILMEDVAGRQAVRQTG